MSTALQAQYRAFVATRFNFMQNEQEALMHAAVGLAGEWVELIEAVTDENAQEELGDFEFYLAACCLVLRYDPQPVSPEEAAPRGLVSMLSLTGAVLDAAKKVWVYQKDTRTVFPQIARELDKITAVLPYFYRVWELSREDTLTANIAKLRLRYPDGYSNAAAQARADKEPGK